jgi:hypothetical protein
MSTKYPIAFRRQSVIPIWLAFWTAMRDTAGSEIESMIAFSYGAFAVIHCPGSADDSLDKIR